MNFNWKDFREEKIVVHCDTEEEALDFLYECEKRNFIVDYRDIRNDYHCEQIKKLLGGYALYVFAHKSTNLYSNCKIIDWKIEEPKTYKAWELEEGKIYKSVWDDISLYRVTKEGVLEEYNVRLDSWYNNYLQYNAILNWLFYEVKKEIDWNKVPRGTKVQVRNDENNEWENRYFVRYDNTHLYNFEISCFLDDNFVNVNMEDYSGNFKHCRIHPSVTIPNEWYKKINKNN